MSSKLCFGLERFFQIFGREKCKIIGMIHVEALPGNLRYIKQQVIGKISEQILT